MEETFNVENPIRENIDYAFKNLIFYVTASTQLDIYIEQKENFKKVLDEINTILAIYVNKESLVSINEEKLQNIKFDLIDLDTETKSLKSYFAEWSLLWLDAIISLRMSEIRLGGVNNGR
ncbi:MAG: hypothetical protein ACI4VR_01090 [Bacilli bacterium]